MSLHLRYPVKQFPERAVPSYPVLEQAVPQGWVAQPARAVLLELVFRRLRVAQAVQPEQAFPLWRGCSAGAGFSTTAGCSIGAGCVSIGFCTCLETLVLRYFRGYCRIGFFACYADNIIDRGSTGAVGINRHQVSACLRLKGRAAAGSAQVVARFRQLRVEWEIPAGCRTDGFEQEICGDLKFQ